MKASETDATKRALATFGNPFGLALYDKELSQVTRPPRQDKSRRQREEGDVGRKLSLLRPTGQRRQFAGSHDFVEAVMEALPQLESLETLYAFWEANLENFAAILDYDPNDGRDAVDAIVTRLKAHARELGGVGSEGEGKDNGSSAQLAAQPDEGSFGQHGISTPARAPIPKERRIRDADHLKFVARHPCIVCGRRPAQAHHVRFAQPTAMAMKVSDEYTVPLCVGHHDSVHRTGDERAWWAARNIDPLDVALRLWLAEDKSAEDLTYRTEAVDTVSADDVVPAGPTNGKDSG